MVLVFKTLLPFLPPGSFFGILQKACLLGFIPLMVACIPEPLEVKGIPQVNPEIVVATQIIPDSTLVVLLTKTIGALEASEDSDPTDLLSQISVSDASVLVSGPSGSYPLLNLGFGLYGGVIIPFEPGETYQLQVNSSSLGTVKASTTVKKRENFKAIMAQLYYNEFNDTLAQINYTLDDKEGKNWYVINVQEVKQKNIVRNLLNPRDFTVLMDDAEFDGQQVAVQFRVFPRDFAPGDTIAVSLANVSENYYQFMKMRMDNRFSYLEFLSEPINYPTNVEGGKGFFNLYIPDIHLFVLE